MMSYQTEINLRELWLGETRQAWLTHLEGLAHRHRPLGQWSLGEWLGYILQGKEKPSITIYIKFKCSPSKAVHSDFKE